MDILRVQISRSKKETGKFDLWVDMAWKIMTDAKQTLRLLNVRLVKIK